MTTDDPVDALNVAVTKAIRLAERLEGERKLTEAAAAYAKVSEYEAALAALLPADDIEGAIARVGAVTAALRAGHMAQALDFAGRYKADAALAEARREEIDAAFALLAPQKIMSPRQRPGGLLKDWRRDVRRPFEEAA